MSLGSVNFHEEEAELSWASGTQNKVPKHASNFFLLLILADCENLF